MVEAADRILPPPRAPPPVTAPSQTHLTYPPDIMPFFAIWDTDIGGSRR
jgi:hypothetical protein